MFKEVSEFIVAGFDQYGLESIGYLIMGLCFGMFFIRSTQKKRFHLISAACYILAFGTILLVVLPSLVVLNPNFKISEEGYDMIDCLHFLEHHAFFMCSMFEANSGGMKPSLRDISASPLLCL